VGGDVEQRREGCRGGKDWVRFYLLALGFSWAGWIPFAASRVGLLPLRVPWEIPLFAQFGPSLVALILTGLRDGKHGVRKLLGRVCRWRVRPRWYLLALLIVPAIAAIWLMVHAALGDPLPTRAAWREWYVPYTRAFGTGGVYALDPTPPPSLGLISFLRRLIRQSPWWAAANFVVFTLLTGPVSEEFGWRGYLLPRLQGERSPLKASLIVGVLWGFWHTGPDFWRILLQGDPRAFLYPLAMTLGTVPLSILFTWMFNGTRGSLLPVMLFHASFNATLYLLSLVWAPRSALVIGAELVAGLWLVAIAVALRRNTPISRPS
jgi:membrane protease YdiL (CAAX protease family)